ncbi:DUF4397 domain-containing protein [Halohasta litorea]|uniref:DUF4397 domain-containing protein n=1 Tax=Halohasta litorea TaxID=869891 RepID=A0ABD6D3R7_9EURY|nr:DUF4397 domain-containing protein [Halohasta litorea]MEA1931446.1 DUF4397 domain-containing protein [Euryarchaeota archaeon]
MNDSRRRDFLKVAGGVAVVGSLAGCAGEAQEDGNGGGNETEGEQPDAPEQNETEDEQPEEEQPEDEQPEEGSGEDLIQIAHMIPDFPAVDVYVDDGEEPVVSDLEYTDVTGYIPLAAGDHQIRVTAAGSQALSVFDEQVSVPAGNTTAVALPTPEEGNGGGGMDRGFQLELYSDENTAPENSINNSRLRAIHASPDAPAVDVLVGQTPVFEGVAFGDAAYFDLPAGDYELSIVPANGGTNGGAGGGNESENGGDGGIFSSLQADGGSDISLLQEEDEGENETVPEEDEAEDAGPEAVLSFDVTTEPNGVYTAFVTGYLDPEAANSEAELEVVVTQDVIEGEVAEAEDD